MQFERLRARNMGPFKGEIDLDLTKIEGLLIAVRGENGAGKTTLLGMFPGALYRDVPKRGPLTELAGGRDSYLEATVVNGSRYTVRQLVDGLSGKGETVILREDGSPVLSTGKVREADAWIASHFPEPTLLYSSSFSPQGERGIFDLSASERKVMFSRALRLEHIERMADEARERVKAATAELGVLRARLGELAAPDMEALEARARECQAQLDTAAQAHADARSALERAVAAQGDAARAAELRAQRVAAKGRLDAARARLADIAKRIANNRALLDREGEVRAAVARVEQIGFEVEQLRGSMRASQSELDGARAAEKTSNADKARAQIALDGARARMRKASQRLEDREKVARASERLIQLRADEQSVQDAISFSEQRTTDLEKLVLSAKDARIAGLRTGLTRLVDEDDDVPFQDYARETLTRDDYLAYEAEQAPSELAGARAHLTALRQKLASLRGAISDAERLAARAGEMLQATQDLQGAAADEASALDEIRAAGESLESIRSDVQRKSEAVETLNTQINKLCNERTGLATPAALASDLDRARARIEELEAQIEPNEKNAAAGASELAALPDLDVETVDVASYEKDLKRAQGAENEARDVLARAHLEIERARDTLARRATLEDEIGALETELNDWTRLAKDLGRDGVQAMEIDAALPALNEVANTLLHSCFGTRWTVEFRTDRLSADGKKTIEDLEVRAIDTMAGREGLAEKCSGGELVIVGTAVSLALTALACKRFGGEKVTLVRDESAAALSPANARAWVTMLRRAAQILNVDKILMVTHSPDVAELADARITIEDGKVLVS